MGRRGPQPKTPVDERTIAILKGLGRIQCTQIEAAAALDISKPTFQKLLNEHPECREAFEQGAQQGRVSLRRTQFNMAAKSVAMAIFLGKNYLGQSDRQDLRPPGDDDEAAAGADDKRDVIVIRGGPGPAPAGLPQPPADLPPLIDTLADDADGSLD